MHTKEPWDVRFDLGNPDGSQWSVVDAIGFFIADCFDNCGMEDRMYGEANARRIAACVNACAGVPTEALEMHGLAGITSSTERILREQCDTAMDERIAAGKRIEELEQQRDELMAALQMVLDSCIPIPGDPHNGLLARDAARAAIAKVTQS